MWQLIIIIRRVAPLRSIPVIRIVRSAVKTIMVIILTVATWLSASLIALKSPLLLIVRQNPYLPYVKE